MMFFVQEDGEDHFWQANLGKQTFLSLFVHLATFANLVKKCARFGKCKSYNAKHGWGGLLVWTYGLMDKALDKKYQPNGVCICMCVCVCVCVQVLNDCRCWLSMTTQLS